MPRNARTIIESSHFVRDLKEIEKSVKRADDFLAGVKVILAVAPYKGRQIPNSAIWTLSMSKIAEEKSVTLYYTFNDDQVLLLSITAF